MNTLIHYGYRDGANYKQHAAVVFTGLCTAEQEAALRASCMQEDDTDFFVPHPVGIEELNIGWEEDIDHPFHHLCEIEQVAMPAQDPRTVDELIEDFQARDWQADAARVSFEHA